MKNNIYFWLAIFFFLGSIIMIEEDIIATIFFGIISFIFAYLGKEKIIEGLQNIKNTDREIEEKLKQQEFEKKMQLKQKEYDDKIKKIKIQIEYEKEMQRLTNILNAYKLVPPTETEIKITITKIQEVYKELGFNVKVIDIRKNKYNTEYEIIFDKNIMQYQILSSEISQKLRDEFAIDGVSIKPKKGTVNHLFIAVPFEYRND